jgi:hypothetical protein
LQFLIERLLAWKHRARLPGARFAEKKKKKKGKKKKKKKKNKKKRKKKKKKGENK